MDTDAIIRQLTIDTITDTPNDIISFMENLRRTMVRIDTDVVSRSGYESVYYTSSINNITVMFYYDASRKYLQCDYEHYWIVIEKFLKLKQYDCNSDDMLKIIKYLVEYYLNINPGKIEIFYMDRVEQITAALKTYEY